MRNIIQGIEATTLLAAARGDLAPAVARPEPLRFVVMWRVVTRPGSALPRLVPVRE